MPTYTLTLVFDTTDLQTIYAAGEQVVVAPALGDSASNVAWVTFSPFQNNQIAWQESHGLYAAQSSGMVKMQSTTGDDIPAGTYYNLTSAGVFEGPFTGAGAPPAGSYRAFNQMPSPAYLAFGLIQAAVVNGTQIPAAPVNSANVPASQFGTFTPSSAVYVWLQSNVAAGDIVQVPPPAGAFRTASSSSTLIQFPGGVTDLAYKYDAKTGGFVSGTT
jgi:hypothetical protein